MDITIPQEPSGLHVLPDAEIERLELLALASAALIAHAEELAELELQAPQPVERALAPDVVAARYFLTRW